MVPELHSKLALFVTYSAAIIYRTALDRCAAATFQQALAKKETQWLVNRGTCGRWATVKRTKQSGSLQRSETCYFSFKIQCHRIKSRKYLIVNKAKRIICVKVKKIKKAAA